MKGDIRYQLRLDNKAHTVLTNDAAEITVHESIDSASTCSVKVAIDICKDEYYLVNDTTLLPGTDKPLSVVIWIDGQQTVIFHGPITERKVDLKQAGPGSSIDLSATDRRILLDRKCRNYDSHSGSIDSIVKTLLRPLKGSKSEVESFDKNLYGKGQPPLNQTESNLSLIQKLAGDVSAQFWLDWQISRDKVTETAHFATVPPSNSSKSLLNAVAKALTSSDKPSLQLNAGSKCSSLLSFNSNRKGEVPQKCSNVTRVDPRTGTVKSSMVSGPSVKALGTRLPTQDISCEVLSAGNIEMARSKAEAAINDASWAVEATGETTVHALTKLLRPRMIVNVQGVGKPDEGDYLVWAVDHQITPAEHKMKLTLRRNADGGK